MSTVDGVDTSRLSSVACLLHISINVRCLNNRNTYRRISSTSESRRSAVARESAFPVLSSMVSITQHRRRNLRNAVIAVSNTVVVGTGDLAVDVRGPSCVSVSWFAECVGLRYRDALADER